MVLLTAQVKIMYTDYEQVAVIYMCDRVLEDDSCDGSKVYVDIMTRHRHERLSVMTLEKLKEVVKKACFEPGDLGLAEHNSE
jgi:hypothetical protein